MEYSEIEKSDEEDTSLASRMMDELDFSPNSLDVVIQKAAKHLPPGFVINIKIERERYNVELENDEGISKDVDGGDGFTSDINEAICIANGFDS